MPVERLAEARDVAVAEDRPHAAEQRHLASVVRSCAARRDSGPAPAPSSARIVAHARASLLAPARRASTRRSAPRNSRARRVTRSASSIAPASHARAGSWKIVRPDGEAAALRLPAASAKPRASVVDRRAQAQQHDAAAIRVALGDQRVDRRPLAGRTAAAASTTRDRCRGCRAASSRAAGRPAPRGRRFGGTISSSSSCPLACTASYSAFTCASFSSRLSTSSSGWNGTRHLTTCSTGQRDQRRADRAPVLEHDRIGAGPLDRPPDPPAAAGRRVERVLAVAVVAQQPDAPCEARAPPRSRATASTKSFFSAGSRPSPAPAARASSKNWIAVVEREDEELGPRRARRGHAVQARQRGVAVGPRNALGVGEVVVELDARGHRRRAAVPRHDQRAAGVGVAAAVVVVLAAHPAGQEARRERVARAQHVQHLDLDALAVERVVERARNRRRRSPRSPSGRA